MKNARIVRLTPDGLTAVRRLPRPSHGIARSIARGPLALYRVRLGWLLGRRFLVLIHRGRRTGRLHRTVLEVVGHEKETGTYYVVSAGGTRADWYRNVLARPHVVLGVGARHVPAVAVRVLAGDADRIFAAYARRHPYAVKWLTRLLGTEVDQATGLALPSRMAMVALLRVGALP